MTSVLIPLVRTVSHADLTAKLDEKCRLVSKTGREKDVGKN